MLQARFHRLVLWAGLPVVVLTTAVLSGALSAPRQVQTATEASCIEVDQKLGARVKAEIDHPDWSNVSGFTRVVNDLVTARRYCQEGRVHEGLWRYQHAERTLGMLQTSRLK